MKDHNRELEDDALFDDDVLDPSEQAQAEELALFAASIGHAVAPRAMGDAAHEEILARALGGIDAPVAPTPHLRDVSVGASLAATSTPLADAASALEPDATKAEERAASQLRDALAARDLSHPLVALAEATRLALDPKPVPELVSARHLRAAVAAPSKVVFLRRAAFVGVALAAAAAILLFVQRPKRVEAPSASLDPTGEVLEFMPGMVESRTTTTLFEPEDFPRGGGERARIDRISNARKADLRQNQFVAWGAE